MNLAGQSQDINRDAGHKKSPGTRSPGMPFIIPCATLLVHEEPTSLVMDRSSGFRFFLIAALPIHKGQWLYGFRPRSQRRVRNGFAPFSLKSLKDQSMTVFSRLTDDHFVVNRRLFRSADPEEHADHFLATLQPETQSRRTSMGGNP